MLTVACVLYVNMGLRDAIVERVGFSLPITGCPRCLTFWSVLAYSLLGGFQPVPCVASSFLYAYAAVWLTLAYDALSSLYNKLYDRITTAAAEETASDENAESRSDALP